MHFIYSSFKRNPRFPASEPRRPVPRAGQTGVSCDPLGSSDAMMAAPHGNRSKRRTGSGRWTGRPPSDECCTCTQHADEGTDGTGTDRNKPGRRGVEWTRREVGVRRASKSGGNNLCLRCQLPERRRDPRKLASESALCLPLRLHQTITDRSACGMRAQSHEWSVGRWRNASTSRTIAIGLAPECKH